MRILYTMVLWQWQPTIGMGRYEGSAIVRCENGTAPGGERVGKLREEENREKRREQQNKRAQRLGFLGGGVGV